MATNICLDCAYFLACKKASEEKRECKEFKFIRREIIHEKEKNNSV